MRHLYKGRKLKRTSSHRRALMRNLATALITHKRISTTEAKAKELRPYVEKLITRAKKALVREQQNLLGEGQKVDVHARRMVSADVFGKGAVQELFDVIAPKVMERPGGYCRIVKTGVRVGDAARTAVIQLVDWYDVQDGTIGLKKKKKSPAKPKATKSDAPKMDAPKKSTKVATETVAEPVAVAEPVPAVQEAEVIVDTPIVDAAENVEENEIIASNDDEAVTIKKNDE